MVADSGESLFGKIGMLIAPIFKPLGFGEWKKSVALLSGLIAKEAVVSIDDPEKIRQYIKFVTATDSKTGTTSTTGKAPQDVINDAIANIDDDQPIMVDIPDIDDDQW